MIQPSDLRLGNLVGLVENPGVSYRVRAISSNILHPTILLGLNGERIRVEGKGKIVPLRITENELIYLGFEQIWENMFRCDPMTVVLSPDGARFSFGEGGVLHDIPPYLHKIQNVYYAFTNQDLTY